MDIRKGLSHGKLQNNYSDFMVMGVILFFTMLIFGLLQLFKYCTTRHHNSAIAAAANLGPANITVSTSAVIDVSRLLQLQKLPLSIVVEEENSSEGPGSDLTDECAICLEKFSSGEEMRVLPDCKHTFHRLCIDPWLLQYSSSCPICRGNTLTA